MEKGEEEGTKEAPSLLRRRTSEKHWKKESSLFDPAFDIKNPRKRGPTPEGGVSNTEG